MGKDVNLDFPKLIEKWLISNGKNWRILRAYDRKHGGDGLLYKKVLVDVLYKEYAINMKALRIITGFGITKMYELLNDIHNVREKQFDLYSKLYKSLYDILDNGIMPIQKKGA